MTDLSPPWVIFSDERGPIAILPAGRPGEVANVRKLPAKTVRAIVAAANLPFTTPSFGEITERLESIAASVTGKPAPLTVRVPQLVPPSPNSTRREHWSARSRRVNKEKRAVELVLSQAKRPELPVTVTLVRCAPRPLDIDNLWASMKGPIDAVADWLGVDDADPGLTWKVEQRTAPRKEQGTVLKIEGLVYSPEFAGDVQAVCKACHINRGIQRGEWRRG